MGTRSFLGVKSGQGMTLTPHPLLVPRSRKSRAIPLLPVWAVQPVQSLSASTRVLFTFLFYPYACNFMYLFSHVVAFVCGLFVFETCILFVLLTWYAYCCDLSSDFDSMDTNKYKHKHKSFGRNKCSVRLVQPHYLWCSG